MKLSIVIPVYNAEKNIHILLDSVLCSNKEFEVICVNDGSSDNSTSVINSYNDSRVKVFTKENEGTFKAWQYGVKYATGDYITIFDQDDYIDSDYIDFIYEFMNSIQADILFTPYYVEQENGERSICKIGIDEGVYKYDGLSKISDKLLGGMVPYAKFTKVVRRELYERQVANTYQGQLRDYEDWLTLVEIFKMANSIYIKNKPYYHYIQYSNSVSKSTISYKRNYVSLMTILNFMKNDSSVRLDERNYNSFGFRALNILLGKCLQIGEYDLANEIVSHSLFHDNVISSDINIFRKIVFYTKSIWIVKLYRKIRGKE